jgi:Domain of Unknown Function (DUF1080)
MEPFDRSKRAMLTQAVDVDEFLSVWRWGDWNAFTVHCVGELPRTTVWINDLLVAEIDLGSLQADNYDPDAVREALGRQGHIALEVHDTDPMLGADRWAPTARCRWRNLRIREL